MMKHYNLIEITIERDPLNDKPLYRHFTKYPGGYIAPDKCGDDLPWPYGCTIEIEDYFEA